jgi:hypothetical protein
MDAAVALEHEQRSPAASNAAERMEPPVVRIGLISSCAGYTDSLCTLRHVSSDDTSCLTPIPTNLLQAGSLTVGGKTHPLYKGINAIGRESADDEHNRDRVEDWRADWHRGGVQVSVLMLANRTISSKHAIICE